MPVVAWFVCWKHLWFMQKWLNRSRCRLVWIWVDPSNYALNGCSDPPWKGAILGWGRDWLIVKYRDHKAWAIVRRMTRLSWHLTRDMWTQGGPRNRVLDEGSDLPMEMDTFWGISHPLKSIGTAAPHCTATGIIIFINHITCLNVSEQRVAAWGRWDLSLHRDQKPPKP